MYVRINDNVLTDLVMQNGATTTGNGVAMPVAGRAGMVMQVSGTFEATVVFEATQDEVNWIAILGQNMNTGGQVTSTTAPGLFAFAVNGLKSVRARISAIASGAVIVKGTMSPMPLAGLSSSVINATVDAVKIKDVTGTNTLGVEADGSALMKLTSSTLQDTQTAPKSIPTNQAMKDIAMRAYENIIDTIGAENIKLLLPLWETSGTEFSDLLRPHVKFIAEGVTLGQSGLLHPVPSFDGVNDYVRQKPLVEATAGSSEFALNSETIKAAQKIAANTLYSDTKFYMLKLKKVGAPVATLQVKLVEDNAGQPTGTVVATSATIDAASVLTTAALHGLYNATAYNSDRSKTYWLVLEYASATTVDASNYISWVYDSAGAYGQPRAAYDGATWTVTSGQSHAFAVYSNSLTLSGDFSIILSVAINGLGKTFVCPAIGKNISDSGSLLLGTGLGRSNLQVYSLGGGDSGLDKQILAPTYPVFDVYGYTFSYADSTDKLKLYCGTSLLNKSNGTASTGANPPQQPFVIGATRNVTNYSYYCFMNGKIGPVIVTSNVLTQAQLGKIQNQLLALRRLREAV